MDPGQAFAILSNQIDTAYYGCCDTEVKLAAKPPTAFVRHIADLARQIWEGHDFQGIDPTLLEAYGNRLQAGIEKGFGKPLVNIDFDTPDHELVSTLLNNTWQFSTAKTYSQLRDMTEALVGPDGAIRSWQEYKHVVGDISGKHLGWLRTEYDSAIGGAQMAKKWKEIQDQKGSLPYLQFDAVRDKNTTALCSSLDGVVLPVDDPFWQTYYPPNHFNCRSTVRQLRNATPTPPDEIVYPTNVPAMFQVNLGQRGLAFPTDHAYFEGMPPEVFTQARRHFPYELQFDRVQLPQGHQGVLRRHFMADTTSSDYQRVLDTAIDKAKDDILVDVLPTLDPDNYPVERTIIFKGAKKGKSPDLRVGSNYVEEEASTNSGNPNNIKHAIGEGSKQANHVIVTLSQQVGRQQLERLAKGRFIDHHELMVIEFRYGGETIRLEREAFIKSQSQ